MKRAHIRGQVDLSRLVIGAIMIALLVAVMTWLQGRFDASDHKKAVAAVRGYVPKGGGTPLIDALLVRHPKVSPDKIAWSSEILSSYRGHVRVHAQVPKAQVAGRKYSFDIDVNRGSIHPTDPTTIEILESLTSTKTATSAR